MASKFKITMLGLSGSGKTCFLLAMYEKMSFGIEGFTLSTDPDTDLELSERWETLVNNVGSEKRWPDPTGKGDFAKYDFKFNYGLNTTLIEFDWIDYRGGALKDNAKEGDMAKLLARLKETDCVIICVPGDCYTDKSEAKKRDIVKRVNILLSNQCFKEISPTIIILITKADICAEVPGSEIKKRIVQDFSLLFAETHNGPVMIAPVTLGKELASNPNGGEIEPIQIHIPLIFTIYSHYMNVLSSLDANIHKMGTKIDYNAQEMRDLENRGMLTKLWDKVRGNDATNRTLEQGNELREQMKYLTKSHQEFKTKLGLLWKQLDLNSQGVKAQPYYIFVNGREASLTGKG